MAAPRAAESVYFCALASARSSAMLGNGLEPLCRSLVARHAFAGTELFAQLGAGA